MYVMVKNDGYESVAASPDETSKVDQPPIKTGDLTALFFVGDENLASRWLSPRLRGSRSGASDWRASDSAR
jgi:hypothetical protein